MKSKAFLSIVIIVIFISFFTSHASAFSTLSEKGSYFVRAINITVPLRGDLIWGPVFGDYYWNRNMIGSMRYTGRIYYPALNEVKTSDQYSIFFPADRSNAPYPAVVFLQGANVDTEQYEYLFEHITSYGYIVLAVTEFMPSGKNLEGQFLNLFPDGAAEPAVWLTSMMLPDLVTYLENINTSVHDPIPIGAVNEPDDPNNIDFGYKDVVRNPRGTTVADLSHSLFEGMVDTNNIVLAGHSMGGMLALLCSNTGIVNPPRPLGGSFTNHIVGCFVYGAHSFTSSGTGYPTPVNVPLLMLGGEKDGVAAGPVPGNANASGYERIKYTFNSFVPASGNNSRYIIGIKGANHLSVGTRPDPLVDRSFLDGKDGIISSFIAHQIIQEKVMAFLEYYTKGNTSVLSVITGSGSEPFIYDYAVK